MKMTAEQEKRWIKLHERQADVARAMVPGPDDDTFTLIAAEVEKVNAEIDELLREVLGEDAYQEHRRELAAELGKTRKQADADLRDLVGEDVFRAIKGD